MSLRVFAICAIAIARFGLAGQFLIQAAEPPAIDPFAKAPAEREDAVPGYVELSDGSLHPGLIYLTRGKRLKIYDEKTQKQREVPWEAVRQIDCKVKREWMEKEWRFKESANDEKVYTGRSYPAREYIHSITLRDGRTITSPLSAIVYVKPKPSPAADPDQQGKPADGARRVPATAPEPDRFLLHKRDKGKLGEDLKSLLYVKRIRLGKEALEEASRRATERQRTQTERDAVRPR